jgi:hypothetical protein
VKGRLLQLECVGITKKVGRRLAKMAVAGDCGVSAGERKTAGGRYSRIADTTAAKHTRSFGGAEPWGPCCAFLVTTYHLLSEVELNLLVEQSLDNFPLVAVHGRVQRQPAILRTWVREIGSVHGMRGDRGVTGIGWHGGRAGAIRSSPMPSSP